MNEVKKFFADAFRHLGSNRAVPRSRFASIPMPACTTRSGCVQDGFMFGYRISAKTAPPESCALWPSSWSPDCWAKESRTSTNASTGTIR